MKEVVRSLKKITKERIENTMKKLFTSETFLEYQFISDCQISPDGGYTAFIVKKADIKENAYTSQVYILNNKSGELKQITSINSVGAYAWEDENTILFPALRNEKVKEAVKDGKQCMSYYALSLNGGEAEELFRLPIKGGKLNPIGKGLYAVIDSYDNDRPIVEGLSEEEQQKKINAYNNRHYEHFKEIPYAVNGEGYVSRKRKRLYLYDSNINELKAITAPMFNVVGMKISDGKILYVGQEFKDVKGLKNGVYVFDTNTNTNVCILEKDKYIVKGFELYQNQVILNLTDALSYGNGENGDFYTIDIDTKEMKLLSEHQHHCIGNTVTSDVKMGVGQTTKVDGEYIYYTSTVDMDCIIERIHIPTGKQEKVTQTGSVDFIDVKDGNIVCVAFLGDRLPEVYTVENGTLCKKTHLNDHILEEYKISEPEYIESKGSSKWEIQGYVYKPVDYEVGKKYPAVLVIHGGPRLTYGPYFMHEMQVFASAGYFVFFCNPRGSEGRGNAFADIRKQFGDIDYIDFMEFTDTVLEKYTDIDKTKLAVEGGSYGGFMTNWIIGHTNRFAVACAQRSIANWSGMEGTTDIGYYFCKGQTGASHMENHELQWKQSPLAYADKCVTPTLFLHGEKDYRCYMQEAFQMFSALKIHGCPTKLCLFEGENHELSRSGRPKQKLQRLVEMLDWFSVYIKKDNIGQ
ncbi:TPA: S9 family peptidase [Clostridioides difficile]|uniref:Peptidase, S9A/B/C family, catalytic domain protein n=1 Tax=Clostridioides difficile NAP08 TaxID=525259 RepID=D5Q0M8_CLODI|nr:peptidase, S9A/B/C family, catalytic domain protein [Clostridioides difficile NAP08]EFH14235.1 peptidase, S9A/B/C family, catalytic domain protein [Clostridioides difficile NAP07]EII6768542.1 S9 family peptidase [Clostridioides difficile]EII6786717.1 S9 family peptidase [Clostridioides difficile]EIS9387999.1 S9 family peptidase [Clostridioides difficile]